MNENHFLRNFDLLFMYAWKFKIIYATKYKSLKFNKQTSLACFKASLLFRAQCCTNCHCTISIFIIAHPLPTLVKHSMQSLLICDELDNIKIFPKSRLRICS